MFREADNALYLIGPASPLAAAFPGIELGVLSSGAEWIEAATKQCVAFPDIIRRSMESAPAQYGGDYEWPNFSAHFNLASSQIVRQVDVVLSAAFTNWSCSSELTAIVDCQQPMDAISNSKTCGVTPSLWVWDWRICCRDRNHKSRRETWSAFDRYQFREELGHSKLTRLCAGDFDPAATQVQELPRSTDRLLQQVAPQAVDHEATIAFNFNQIRILQDLEVV